MSEGEELDWGSLVDEEEMRDHCDTTSEGTGSTVDSLEDSLDRIIDDGDRWREARAQARDLVCTCHQKTTTCVAALT